MTIVLGWVPGWSGAQLVLGGALRTVAFLLLALGVVMLRCPIGWPRWTFTMRPLQQLSLADGRTLTAYHVGTPAFARDFVAVRLEERTWLGLWCINYVARGVTRDATLALVDANHVRVQFLTGDEHDPPSDRVVAIPPR